MKVDPTQSKTQFCPPDPIIGEYGPSEPLGIITEHEEHQWLLCWARDIPGLTSWPHTFSMFISTSMTTALGRYRVGFWDHTAPSWYLVGAGAGDAAE